MPFKSSHIVLTSTFAAFGLLATACGGDDGDRQAKIDLLIAEGETQQSAECYVDELPGYGLSDFEKLSSAESVDEVDEEFFEAALDASGVCE